MNPTPQLHGKDVTHPGCGFVAMNNRDAAFWQSRSTLAGKPAPYRPVIDIKMFAREVRRTYNKV